MGTVASVGRSMMTAQKLLSGQTDPVCLFVLIARSRRYD